MTEEPPDMPARPEASSEAVQTNQAAAESAATASTVLDSRSRPDLDPAKAGRRIQKRTAGGAAAWADLEEKILLGDEESESPVMAFYLLLSLMVGALLLA